MLRSATFSDESPGLPRQHDIITVALDTATVKTIALLARLKVPDEELASLAHELSAIIGWVEQLAEVDTADVAPMTGVGDLTLPWRDDIVADGNCVDAVLANAPAAVDAFYAVPKVVE
jgi:aspartyl-tRNA(Asn)/glutamyl-tRNA(Gln) amidotransferase subunit C